MTRTPLSRLKGQRSRSPGRFTHRGVNASGSCSGERGNVLAVGTYCYVAVCTLQALSAWRREALRRPQREERGGGILWRPPAYSLFTLQCSSPVRRNVFRRMVVRSLELQSNANEGECRIAFESYVVITVLTASFQDNRDKPVPEEGQLPLPTDPATEWTADPGAQTRCLEIFPGRKSGLACLSLKKTFGEQSRYLLGSWIFNLELIADDLGMGMGCFLQCEGSNF